MKDTESVNKQMLSKEMKLLKNRLSARRCREKKKNERNTIETQNQELKKEVVELRKNLVYLDLLDDLKTIGSQCNFNEEYEAYFPKYRVIQKTLQSNEIAWNRLKTRTIALFDYYEIMFRHTVPLQIIS